MCRSKNGQSIIERIPSDRVLTETDAPYNNKVNINQVLTVLNMKGRDVYANFKRLLDNLK